MLYFPECIASTEVCKRSYNSVQPLQWTMVYSKSSLLILHLQGSARKLTYVCISLFSLFQWKFCFCLKKKLNYHVLFCFFCLPRLVCMSNCIKVYISIFSIVISRSNTINYIWVCWNAYTSYRADIYDISSPRQFDQWIFRNS